MKDKILKQIEEKAIELFPFAGLYDELFSERYHWSNGAKFGYNIKESVDVDWKMLRDEYFEEHVQKDTGNYIHITTSPHDLFEWFKSKLSASKNTVSNEGEKERLIDFLCYLNDNKMINNYDFDYEEQASEYLETINPPKEK